MSKPITIVSAPCSRCGKQLASTTRSLYGLDGLKERTGVICLECTTADEWYELNKAIGKGIIEGPAS